MREAKNSTGKHDGSLTDIKDGYAHTATASVGDIVDYQIISTLPTITSKASSLSEYTYVDTLSEGIKYNKNDVVIEFFRDSACTDKITTWDENSGKFTATYDDTANTMTIRMTETGLVEINEATSVYTDSVKRGYSNCTMRITYAATLTADAKMGDTDNPNEVELTWRRTNSTYFDTLSIKKEVRCKRTSFFMLSLSKNYPNAPASAIIEETGVFSWKAGEKMHGGSQSS